MLNDKDDYLLCIRCLTFNQADYIKDALDGFCMQKTDFPFYVALMDDASTDGEQEVIKSYLDQHFEDSEASGYKQWETEEAVFVFARHKENVNCRFLVVYLKRNLYKTPRKDELIAEWCVAKYMAFCEGDDYWTDPLKLQKQVDVLEESGQIDMCCTDTLILSPKGESRWPQYDESRLAAVEDVIMFGLGGKGVCFQTATFVFKSEILSEKGYLNYCTKCHVGDYPLLLWAALNGGVYYLNEVTAVYRLRSDGSWTIRQKSLPVEKKIPGWRSEIDMLKSLDAWSQGTYSKAFQERIGDYLYGIIKSNTHDAKPILCEFHDELSSMNMRQRLYVFVVRCFPRVLSLVKKTRNKVKGRNY